MPGWYMTSYSGKTPSWWTFSHWNGKNWGSIWDNGVRAPFHDDGADLHWRGLSLPHIDAASTFALLRRAVERDNALTQTKEFLEFAKGNAHWLLTYREDA